MNKGKQLTLWPGGTSLYRKRSSGPASFINRAGKKVSLRKHKEQESSVKKAKETQLDINFNPFIPVPRKPVPSVKSNTYFAPSSGKIHTRAAKPSPQTWVNPKYKNLEESYNFLMSYYKSLEN